MVKGRVRSGHLAEGRLERGRRGERRGETIAGCRSETRGVCRDTEEMEDIGGIYISRIFGI